MLTRQYFVYIMMNTWRTTSYIGVTNDLPRRVTEHRSGAVDGFSKQYHCTDLVYYEVGEDILGAIEREKEIKKWSRKKKIALIHSRNSTLKDLSQECFV